MGVYINGMEMPKDYSVIVKIFPDGRVGTIPYVQWFKVDLVPGTQAVPVPPHGDLIDRDYVKEHLYACETNGRPLHTLELCELLDAINDIPTIIPAEEGE